MPAENLALGFHFLQWSSLSCQQRAGTKRSESHRGLPCLEGHILEQSLRSRQPGMVPATFWPG